MNPAIGKSLWIVFLMGALFASGVAVRRVVLNAQYERYGRPLPFDLESALSFRYVRMLARADQLPARDKSVQYPEGVVVRQTYEIGLEYICALGSRLFPGKIALDERVRWVSVLWFCLGIPALFLWIWRLFGSLTGAACAGLFYAVALSGVIRSTGQELSHENFALPLLIGHLAVNAWVEQKNARLWTFIGLSVFSALLLAGALMLWDLIQFYIGIWAVLGCCRAAAGDYFADSRPRLKWGLVLATLVLAGILNPYLRAHGFIFSPAMLLSYGGGLAMPWTGSAGQGAATKEKIKKMGRLVLRIIIILLPLIAGLCLFRKYTLAYGHFAELIWAKIIFLNVKPADPALLTFAQRILWTPALNSANILLTKNLFPASLLLFLFSTLIFIFNPRWRADPKIRELLLFGFISLAAFILFVRLHVFTAVAFAAVIGLLGAWAARQGNIPVRIVVLVLVLAGVAAEGANVLRNPLRWGSGQPYLKERKELVQWLRVNAAGQPVLANFGASAFVCAYAGCGIVLHPKFESAEIRKRMQEYGEMLFKADEGKFRAWAGRYGAAFYIYSLGEFAAVCPEAQMRYFVDALNPPPWAAARLFEFNPFASRWFRLVWQNGKYRVFRIITRADEQTAEHKARTAGVKIEQGLLAEAQAEAESALLYDPANKKAQETILQIDALRERRGKNN